MEIKSLNTKRIYKAKGPDGWEPPSKGTQLHIDFAISSGFGITLPLFRVGYLCLTHSHMFGFTLKGHLPANLDMSELARSRQTALALNDERLPLGQPHRHVLVSVVFVCFPN